MAVAYWSRPTPFACLYKRRNSASENVSSPSKTSVTSNRFSLRAIFAVVISPSLFERKAAQSATGSGKTRVCKVNRQPCTQPRQWDFDQYDSPSTRPQACRYAVHQAVSFMPFCAHSFVHSSVNGTDDVRLGGDYFGDNLVSEQSDLFFGCRQQCFQTT